MVWFIGNVLFALEEAVITTIYFSKGKALCFPMSGKQKTIKTQGWENARFALGFYAFKSCGVFFQFVSLVLAVYRK